MNEKGNGELWKEDDMSEQNYEAENVTFDGEMNFDEQSMPPDSDCYLTVTLENGERRLTREEAEMYARMGLEREYEDPVMIKLDYLAASEGISRDEYVDRQLKLREEESLERIVEQYGDDERVISEMLEYENQKNRRLYDELLSQRSQKKSDIAENTHTRLAEEYAELVREFPELEGKGFAELPTEVKRAGFEGERLINAYLRYRHNEERKIKSALEEKNAADRSSTGSMQASAYDGRGEDERHYLKSLWQK